jgi:hypothetical protein
VLTRHPSRRLASYCDGQLPADEACAVEAHLATCARCRRECEEIRFAAALLRQVAVVHPPASVWHALDEQLRAPSAPRSWAPRWQIALAASLVLAAAIAGTYWQVQRNIVRPWNIATLESGREVSSRKAEGDWVETSAAARVRIVIGTIGTVDVEPDTRVRLGALRPDEYRLALSHGTISARISAPPRLFIVDTPASTLVDLGCAYRATVDADGMGDLHVTEGWTSLEWKGREALVPAGASCRIRPGAGPGTPTFDDATATLKAAVAAIDSGEGGSAAVATALTEARLRDTLTLWHLLSRVAAGDRGRVYDRIAELAPPPAFIDRGSVLQLDPAMLTRWREELSWKW